MFAGAGGRDLGFAVDVTDGFAEGCPFGCSGLEGEADSDELEGVGDEDRSHAWSQRCLEGR